MALTFGVGGAGYWWLGTYFQRRAATGPMLTPDARRLLSTYERACLKLEDCEPPLSCVRDARLRGHVCRGNECDTDANCEPGFVCRAIRARGPPVRLCVMAGIRKAGERCQEFPLNRDAACDAALRCNFTFCGRPCQPSAPSSCPENHTCLDHQAQGPSCVPSCPPTGCPEGKQCIRMRGDFSLCGHLDGDDCHAHPCPQGQECGWELSSTSVTVRKWCFQPCDQARPCPEGLACFHGECRTPCDQDGPDTCEPPLQCYYYPQDKLAFCSR